MRDLSPDGLVAGVRALVTLPEVALRVAQMASDLDSSADDMGREIAKDAALMGRLLRVANSPVFGHSQHISTISRAVATIGLMQVRDLTVGLAVIRAFERIPNTLVTMESFWRQSVLCAIAAAHIVARSKIRHSETAFVAGLLHDIGKLVLFNKAPELARQALSMSVDSAGELAFYLCERKVFGFDHAAVGAALARHWGLPPSLQESIEFHHEPNSAPSHRAEVAIVHIANSVAVLADIGSTDSDDAPPIESAALRAAGLDKTQVAEIAAQTTKSAAEMLPILAMATIGPS
jgi:putative nucleotidyltransferase with HDIG domain